jgi:hypothetical protein
VQAAAAMVCAPYCSAVIPAQAEIHLDLERKAKWIAA